jgi:hypothetical protein
LLADSQLTTLMPDGVFFDVAKKGSQRFVIVSQLAHEDVGMFNGSAYEEFTYLVKAVGLSTTGADVKAAATRIHTLLHDGTIAPIGYALMRMRRLERVRYAEVDDVNRMRGGNTAGAVRGERVTYLKEFSAWLCRRLSPSRLRPATPCSWTSSRKRRI